MRSQSYQTPPPTRFSCGSLRCPESNPPAWECKVVISDDLEGQSEANVELLVLGEFSWFMWRNVVPTRPPSSSSSLPTVGTGHSYFEGFRLLEILRLCIFVTEVWTIWNVDIFGFFSLLWHRTLSLPLSLSYALSPRGYIQYVDVWVHRGLCKCPSQGRTCFVPGRTEGWFIQTSGGSREFSPMLTL